MFDIAELRELTAYDELELDTLGDQKTALFLIMSDTDDSFNFLIAMCYTDVYKRQIIRWSITTIVKLKGEKAAISTVIHLKQKQEKGWFR